MIPPISTTQGKVLELHNMVGWKNPFNMRQVTLMNLAASQLGMKNGNKLNLPYHRKTYSTISPTKSLDLLRRNLQNAINRDIENVIKKYIERFFHPAIVNIKNNLGKDSVNDDLMKDVCRRMLEEAKCLYKTESSRDSSPYDYSDSEASVLEGSSFERNSPPSIKRKDIETDVDMNKSNKKMKYKASHDYSSHKLPIKREAPKWNSDRINGGTLFIMGAKANKVLGYGQTRGRLYVRHPELVRYSGDQEDKEWLSSKNLMPPSGGKAYLMILNDIKELTESDDYKNSPNLQLSELKGFEAPPFLMNKIKIFMESVRTDKKSPVEVDLFDFRNRSLMHSTFSLDALSSTSDLISSEESQSGNLNTKHSEFVRMSEASPSSNHSIISVNHSPLSTSRSLMSPNMLLSVTSADGCSDTPVMRIKSSTQNGNPLTNILSQHFGADTTDSF